MSERCEAQEGLDTSTAGLKAGGNQMGRNVGALQKQSVPPGWQPVRKQEPQTYNRRELDWANNLDKLEIRPFPEPPDTSSVDSWLYLC